MEVESYEKNKYNQKILDISVSKLPFLDFFCSRYSMTIKRKAINTYNFAKKNNIPFFNLTLACLLEAINKIPEFKRRIIDNKVIEYENLNAVTPILQKDNSIREIEIFPLSNFKSFNELNEYVQYKKNNIEKEQYSKEPSIRDNEPIANFSCIPWLDFDSMTNIIYSPHQIMPCISWGKLNNDNISISLTASHIFIFGFHFKLFYEYSEKYLNNPELIIKKE